MSFADAMKSVEKDAIARNHQIQNEWAAFYDECSVGDVLHYINDYLADFDFSGSRVRRKYELGVSLCLAQALRHALLREHEYASRCMPLMSTLTAYNAAISGGPNRSADGVRPSSLRLAVAAAVLRAEQG